jgi:hypothetical protein
MEEINTLRNWFFMMKQLLGLLLILSLSACSGGAVVFAPTPLPADAVPTAYQHPSAAFSLLLPGTWSLYQQELSLIASASFAPPDSQTPLVQIAVVNLGREITAGEFGDLVLQYQSQIRPDLTRYTEQDRQAMGDGSWRISGIRQTPVGETQAINTFLDRNGSLMAVIEAVLPIDAALRSQIQTIINTFSMPATADLPVSELAVLSGAARAQVEIINIATWATLDGIFFVTGEVANHSTQAIADVPVRASLLTEEGATLADGLDTVMGYAIPPGGFAPFSIRFGQGQPLNAARYTLALGSATYVPENRQIIGFPILQWTDSTQTSQDNRLFIVGTVSNIGTKAVLSPRAIATVFDDRGRVIAAAFADVDTSILMAGESASFTVLVSDTGGIPANYVVNVQAYPCDASCE